MTNILTAAQMKQADEEKINRGTPSRVLMERAAMGALKLLESEFPTNHVLFLCGNGNNGGDGFAMARFFAEKGGNATVCYTGEWKDGEPDAEKMSVECARQFSLLPKPLPLCDTPDFQGVSAVVDAMFGIGLFRPITGKNAELIQALNDAKLPVLAIDIPSGINADTGAVCGIAVQATHTVAISDYKFGHYLYPGTELCGILHCERIGVCPPLGCAQILEKEDISQLLSRPANTHKGSFGRVLVIGGSKGMSGAGYLCAKAAYRAGAGLVEIMTHSQNRVIYQTQLPEAIVTTYDLNETDENAIYDAIWRADAIAIGMGLGSSRTTAFLVDAVLKYARCPVVMDADALNELARSENLAARLSVCRFPLIFTPHLGEASRLLDLPIDTVSADLVTHAKLLAEKSGALVVLKSARTLITDGKRVTLNPFGNNGMATGGSGDVLSGIIAGLSAGGNPHRIAAELGVLAHALAGDVAREKCGLHGLMASDIIDGLCKFLP